MILSNCFFGSIKYIFIHKYSEIHWGSTWSSFGYLIYLSTDHCSAITQSGNKKYRAGHKCVTDPKSEDVFHLMALSYSEDWRPLIASCLKPFGPSCRGEGKNNGDNTHLEH